jgi:recombination protein RecA
VSAAAAVTVRSAVPDLLGGLEFLQRGLDAPDRSGEWRLSTFLGRFGEISGAHASSPLTLAFRLVLEAQRLKEPVAWIGRRDSMFYPPDAERSGVDLAALAVVRTSEIKSATRAADLLVRSSAFGLVILDLGPGAWMPIPHQTRFMGLARKHHTALVCLTEKEGRHPSLGSLVSLRIDARRKERQGDRYRCEARVLKDKRGRPDWSYSEVCRAPDGLC